MLISGNGLGSCLLYRKSFNSTCRLSRQHGSPAIARTFVNISSHGLTFGLGYPYRYLAHSATLILLAAALELVQTWIPGRHARLNDLAAGVLGLCIGTGLA